MQKPILTYFDAPVSRGEECRLALHVAGIDFEDRRIKREEWPLHKPKTPFGSVPTLEMPGHPVLAQSNAILVLIGRLSGFHPSDPFEAARHEAVMAHVEDLRATIRPTMHLASEDEKKKAREELVAGYLPTWAQYTEKQIAGPFFAGPALNVVDFKLLIAVRWLRSGALDHIPKTIFDGAPKLIALHDAVQNHSAIKAWYAKH